MQLRHLLASISLTAPLAGCCLRDEIWHDRRSVLPAQPTGQLATLIQACKDQEDCEPLCLHDWFEYAPDHYADFESEVRDCEMTVSARTGEHVVTYEGLETCIAGRRPRGYRRRVARASTETGAGAYLAAQAALEAASVRAFTDLLADLVAHGAPRSLRRAAVAAAGDEVRHAQVCGWLARRHRARVLPVTTPAAPRRTLRELAVDNVVEGCVRETFGAAVAGHQARAAADPAIRAAMAAIARDEAKHAQLAWRLHGWLLPRLSTGERVEVAAAARDARAGLRTAAGAEDPELTRVAGLPHAAAARYMLDALEAGVWHTLAA